MARRIVSARDQVEMLSPWRTAGPRRRFNQDWQHIGGDLFPLDVITHYMDRKDEGFGDEKTPLYEMQGRPPLSQQIRDEGYKKPVELCTDGQSGCVYDGHHRIDVARQLGHAHVPVVVTWRNSSGYPEGAYGNKIEPWLKGWLTDMRGGRETVGKIAAANGWGSLSHEDRVSVAENVMERSGFGGKIFHIPTAYLKDAEQLGMFDNLGRPDAHTLQRQHSKEAEDYVNGVLESRGYRFVQSKPYSEVKPLQGDPIKVEPEHWDLRQPGSGQAFTDGYSKIGLAGNHANQLTLLHEAAHILHGTVHDGRREGHGPNFQQTLHDLYREHLGPEAADIFAGIVFPDHRTAAWYHTSPSRLPVGTELTPGGGRSPYDPYYRAVGEPDRRNHVWVEDDPRLLKRWHDIDADANYHYRVEPDGDPRPYRDGDYSQGWVVPRARIVEDLGPAKRRRKGHTAALHPLPQHGVNINDTTQDFTGQILRGEKLIETRNTNSLRPIIGHRVAIIRNHLRQPSGLLVGYATVGEPKIYTNADDFDADYHLHRVAPGSDFHINHPNCKYGVKYGYPLHDVQAEPDPYRIVGPGQPYRYWMQPRLAGVDKSYEQHLRDTYEPYPPDSPNLPDDLKPHLMLPTEVAHHYREYDRPADGENTRMLTRVLGDQGIRQPLKISTDGTHAVLIEGNHRIQAASQLGMSHVPVQVYLEKPGEVMTNSETSRPVPLEPVLGNWIKQNSHQLRSFWS